MNWKKHLLFGILIFLLSVYFLKFNLFSLGVIPLFIVVIIFSLLPDIDHSKSKISFWFRFFYIILGIYSGYKFYINNEIIYLISLFLSIILLIFHAGISSSGFKHRKFPHSFTFGIFASLIVYIFSNLPTAVIGFICFFIHLLLDNHVFKALKYDSRFWKSVFKR